MDDLERRFNELRRFNKNLENASHEEYGNITLERNEMKEDTIELVANQIYDRITKLINDRRKRLGIKGGANIEKPIRNCDNFDLDDHDNLTFIFKNKVINFGNSPITPSRIMELSVNKLKLMVFINITDEDIRTYRPEYRRTREKVRKLNENLGERSKEIKSSSTTDAEAIEMIEMTS